MGTPAARRAWRLLWPLAAPWAIVAAVNAWPPHLPLRRAAPLEATHPTRCTWSCHNHGCQHRHRLPEALSGQHGAFGAAVHALHSAAGPGFGPYRAVNLAVFVVAWPALMYSLLLTGLHQRDRLRALREPRQPRIEPGA